MYGYSPPKGVKTDYKQLTDLLYFNNWFVIYWILSNPLKKIKNKKNFSSTVAPMWKKKKKKETEHKVRAY